jgi:hypothetical protein
MVWTGTYVPGNAIPPVQPQPRFFSYAVEWMDHAGCSTSRFFEDVPRNVPTLWMFTHSDGEHTVYTRHPMENPCIFHTR